MFWFCYFKALQFLYLLGFSQAWAKMVDVESGYNPLVKDVALDSSGKIYAMITYEQLDGTKVYWYLCIVSVQDKKYI